MRILKLKTGYGTLTHDPTDPAKTGDPETQFHLWGLGTKTIRPRYVEIHYHTFRSSRVLHVSQTHPMGALNVHFGVPHSILGLDAKNSMPQKWCG